MSGVNTSNIFDVVSMPFGGEEIKRLFADRSDHDAESAWRSVTSLRSPSNESLLQRAVFYGRVEVVQFLLDGLAVEDGKNMMRFYHRRLQFFRLAAHEQSEAYRRDRSEEDGTGDDTCSAGGGCAEATCSDFEDSEAEDEVDAEILRDIEFDITDYVQVPFYNDISEHPILLALVNRKQTILERMNQREAKRELRKSENASEFAQQEKRKHLQRRQMKIATEVARSPPLSLKREALMHHSSAPYSYLSSSCPSTASTATPASLLLRDVAFEPMVKCVVSNANYFTYSVDLSAGEKMMAEGHTSTAAPNSIFDALLSELYELKIATEVDDGEEETVGRHEPNDSVSAAPVGQIKRLVFSSEHTQHLKELFEKSFPQSRVEFSR